MKRLTYRYQRTLARAVEVRGVGYLTGANVRLCFTPAPPSTGVVFVRTDLSPPVQIAATIDQVTGTNRRTTLGHLPRCVSLVEHVLAALAGLRIDNCYLEIDCLEPPGLDGSAQQFVEALQKAGILTQPANRPVWCVESSVIVARGGANLALHPSKRPGLRASYLLDYGPFSPVQPQRRSEEITPQTFVRNLAPSRTFLLEEEARELQRQGIGKRTRVSDLLVFEPRGPLENRLRFADEPARHKILDLLGDLSLLGHDINGHLVAYRSGHLLNVELVRLLAERLQQLTPGQQRRAA